MPDRQITANQHFVPQFYLRNFTDQNNELHIFNTRDRRRMRPRGSKAVCQDTFFYAVETGIEDALSQEIEEYFQKHIEDPLALEIPLIIEKIEHFKQLTEKDKYTLAIFMNNMWLRGPAMRNMLNRTGEEMIKHVNRRRYDHPSAQADIDETITELGITMNESEKSDFLEMMKTEDYRVNFSNAQHLEFMLNTEHLRGFTNLFFGQYWTIYINKSQRQFVTSDNPITVIIPKRTSFYGATFLERTHLFPLTPTILIETTFPNNEGGKKIKRKMLYNNDENIVDNLNLQIASQSEYVYSNRENEIEWFVKYVKDVEQALNERKLLTLQALVKL